jgi:signal peptidase II
MNRSKYTKLIGIAGSIIVLDQISKAVIKKTVPLYGSITVIPGFFDISHIQNPGGAFGLLADQSPLVRMIVFIFFTSVATGIIFYLYYKTDDSLPFLASGIALIFGGAIGNLIDRIRFGRVVDFLDVYVGTVHYPSFNVADSAVSIGIAIFLYHLIFNKIPK